MANLIEQVCNWSGVHKIKGLPMLDAVLHRFGCAADAILQTLQPSISVSFTRLNPEGVASVP